MKRRTKPVGRKSPAHKQLRKIRAVVNFLLVKEMVRCYFCLSPIGDMMDAVIHHVDRDRENNSKENLVIGHSVCHKEFHVEDRRKRRQYEKDGRGGGR